MLDTNSPQATPAGDASPLLCVVVPTIPGRDSLRSRCLWSVTSQWQPGVQVLCIDGSGHLGDKINLAAAHTTAEYMTVVDDDDYLDGGWMNAVLPLLAFGPDFVGLTVVQWINQRLEGMSTTNGNIAQFDHDGLHHGPSPKGVARTELYRKVRFGNLYKSDRHWMADVYPLIDMHAFADRAFYIYDHQPTFSAFVGNESGRDIGVWPYDPTRVEWLSSN